MSESIIATIDIGNSSSSVAIFQGNNLKEVFSFSQFIQTSYSKNKELKAIASVVGPAPSELKDLSNLTFVNQYRIENSFLDMPINYSNSLGEDRIAFSYYIFKKYAHGKKILAIDAGTFLTADLVTPQGFEGGFIFPGPQVFFDSYGKGKQLLNKDVRKVSASFSGHIPHDTDSAITQAMKLSFLAPLERIIKDFNTDLVVITGGSRNFISQLLAKENQMTFIVEENLVHYGLRLILEKN